VIHRYWPDDPVDHAIEILSQHDLYNDLMTGTPFIENNLLMALDAGPEHLVFYMTDGGRSFWSWTRPAMPLQPGRPQWEKDGPLFWWVDHASDPTVKPMDVARVMVHQSVEDGLLEHGERFACYRMDRDTLQPWRVGWGTARRWPE
jgi:hypothetical protein